ncbi:MAG: radical SAM protein [Rhodospirillales bacterium]
MKCFSAWTHVFANSDNTIGPCCSPIDISGDKNAAPFDPFQSDVAKRLRESLISGDKSRMNSNCVSCPHLLKYDQHSNIFDSSFPLSNPSARSLAGLDAFYANFFLLRDCYEAGQVPPASAKPICANVQLGELCNLQCIMCPQDHASKQKVSRQRIEYIKSIIPYLHTLRLTGGEPMVFGEFLDIVEHFNQHAHPEAWFKVLTNGKLLDEKRIFRNLAEVKNVDIGLNIDAATKNTYEHIRRGGRWEKLMSNIDYFIQYAKDHKKNWKISLTATVMKSNIGEMADLVKLAAKLDVGFACGAIYGDSLPAKNARAYFEENIFRFSHLGYSRQRIDELLSEAVDACSLLSEQHLDSALGTLRGTIDYAHQVSRIDIPQYQLNRLRSLDDYRLSQEIGEYANELKNPFKERVKHMLGLMGVHQKFAATQKSDSNIPH